MSDAKLFQLAAFPMGSEGGNPAGVWIGDELPPAETMQQIAADVGASETAFIAPTAGSRRTVRYFSPEVEVSFCGHATIASGIVLGREDGEGDYELDTSIGKVQVVAKKRDGQMRAALRSVDTQQKAVSDGELQEALDHLRWTCDDLDPAIPAVSAYAGAWHLVLAVAAKSTLDGLDYDFEGLKAMMHRLGLTTLQLIWREDETSFHSRNPFPVGGIFEDPATGAAAAALGGYLRDAGLVQTPFSFTVLQGEAMGSPSLIEVEVPKNGGIIVSGGARDI